MSIINIDFTGTSGQSITTDTNFVMIGGDLQYSGSGARVITDGTNSHGYIADAEADGTIEMDVRFSSNQVGVASYITTRISGPSGSESFIGVGVDADDEQIRLIAFIDGQSANELAFAPVTGNVNSFTTYILQFTRVGTTYSAVLTDDQGTIIASIPNTVYSNAAIDVNSTNSGIRILDSDGEASVDNFGYAQLDIANAAPIVNAGSDRDVVVGQSFNLAATATDADTDPLTITVSELTSVGVVIDDPTSLNTSISGFAVDDIISIRVTADDGVNTPVSDDVTFTGVAGVVKTPVSMELNGFKFNTVTVGDVFPDLGATVTFDDASTEVIFATVPWSTATASRQSYQYEYPGLTTLNRRVNIEEVVITPTSQSEISGIRSWHMNQLDTEFNGRVISGFCSEDPNITNMGVQGIFERNASTGLIETVKYLETALYPDDGHNSVPHLLTRDNRLIVAFTGHGVDRDNNADGTFFFSESNTGRIANLNTPVRVPNMMVSSNYMQLFEMGDSGVGQVVGVTNEDGGSKADWVPFYRTGVNTWEERAPVVRLGPNIQDGGSDQMYAKIFKQTNELYFICTPHPSNLRASLRLCKLNTVTGDVYNSESGASLGNITGGTSASNAISDMQELPIIFRPDVNKTCRLLDCSDDGLMIAVATWDLGGGTTEGNNGEYWVLYCTNPADRFNQLNWSRTLVCTFPLNSYLGPNQSYVGGMTFARDVTVGIGVNTSRVAGSNWTLERWTTPNLSTPFTGEVLRTASGTDKIVRPNSVLNGSGPSSISYAEGPYTEYRDFDTVMKSVDAPASQIDVTIPVITLLGQTSVTINVGDTYLDAGATALDDTDGDITNDIVVVSNLDVNTAGSYLITYDVQDAAGNNANTVTRNVIVEVAQGTTTQLTLNSQGTPDEQYDTMIVDRDTNTTQRFPNLQWTNNQAVVTVQGNVTNYDWYFQNAEATLGTFKREGQL